MHLSRFRTLVIPAAAVLLALPAQAGQVRVSLSGMSFSPASVSLNQGDQVVWVWLNGTHSVTQGPGCSVSNPVFDSDVQAGARFSWKSDRTGSVPYFCIIHCSGGMKGTLTISASGVAVSDFRITEVRSTSNHSADFVEAANLGGAAGNLGQYRLSVAAGSAQTLPLTDIAVPAGGRVVVHFGQSGSNTATNVFIPGATLPATGSAALYVPNTVNTALTDAGMLVDFVEWGAGGQANEATAVAAGAWTAGQFAAAMPDGQSIELCGAAADRGAAFWFGITSPTPGTDGHCASPVQAETWGAVKTRYR